MTFAEFLRRRVVFGWSGNWPPESEAVPGEMRRWRHEWIAAALTECAKHAP